jgi:hypothetical protein
MDEPYVQDNEFPEQLKHVKRKWLFSGLQRCVDSKDQ